MSVQVLERKLKEPCVIHLFGCGDIEKDIKRGYFEAHWYETTEEAFKDFGSDCVVKPCVKKGAK